jgi:hypothetical protein
MEERREPSPFSLNFPVFPKPKTGPKRRNQNLENGIF